MWKGLLIGNSAWMFADEFDVKKNIENERMSTEKGPNSGKFHLPTINFQGIFVSFQGNICFLGGRGDRCLDTKANPKRRGRPFTALAVSFC